MTHPAPPNSAAYAPLPKPFKSNGQQIAADGDDKAFCDLFCIEQMQDFADATHALRTPQQEVPADPMEWRLPCDVTVGHVTMRKGVSLGALVARMKSLYEMATGRNADEVANRTIEQRAALMDSFRARVAQPSQTPIGVVESAVPGAGGFHVRLAAGAQVPPVGEKLYLAAAPQQDVQHFTQALTGAESQPNQYGVEFGMSGTQMHFKIGNQLFKLAYEPDDQEEFEFMKRMLINAFSTFTLDVKTAPKQEVQELLLDGGPPGSGGWKSHAEAMERERDHYRLRAQTMYEHQQGQVWYWQGDGLDNLHSLCNSLPVVIRADQLRRLLAAAQQEVHPPANSLLYAPLPDEPAGTCDVDVGPSPLIEGATIQRYEDGYSAAQMREFADATHARRTQQPAPAGARTCRPLTDADMDAMATWMGHHERVEIGFAKIAELVIQHFATPTAQPVPAAGAVAVPAVPREFLRRVITLCTQRGHSPENIETWSKNDKWIADLWRQAEQFLAAAPTPAAQQEAQCAQATCDTTNYCKSVQRCTARDADRAQKGGAA